ncbi:MAG: toprim domain-containing protein [Chromatiaceae bacterium]|nr:toprim domain-containing protein [Chromatiaceae bacterium]
MARIPDEVIGRLKQEVSLQRLAESQGVKLKRHGADLVGLCPFHDDKEPSLVITPKQNLWHCLGACQTGGSVIDWVMKAEGVSFRHATELLLADYQPSLVADSGPVKQATVRKLPTALEHNAEDAKLLRQVTDYYHETLKSSPEAMAYLEKRGIANSEAIDRFKLGFANRSLGYRLPAKNRKEGAAIRGQLQRLGLYRSSGHEHFTGSIVIPVMDERGQVLEVYGRKINDNLRKGTPLHLYLPGPHQGIWNAEALQASKEIILAESLIDALTFWCAGYRNVTASYGIEGFTADHLKAFREHDTERVLIAYDRDEAGEKAAPSLVAKLIAEGIDAYRIQFPKGMDANEYALQVRPTPKSLGVVIRSAVWLGNGKPKAITTGPADQIEETAPVPTQVTEVPEINVASAPLSAEPLPAVVVPSSPQVEIPAEIKEKEILIPLGDRRYRIRGLDKNLSYEQMKVNLLVNGPAFEGGEAVHVDTLDLYQARPRGLFIKQAASELGVKEDVIKHDLGRVLLKLEALQEERLQAAQEPPEKTVTLTDDETQAALTLLKSPDLLNHILEDFEQCGVVGEATNVLTGYLACVSRKLDNPLAVLIQSTSAAGKSALMEAVLDLMPEEERIQYSAMTGQSLFYLGESDLKHKILAIAEEEGVSEAAYDLKLLQSQGELTIASTGKDPVSGKLVTQEYRVEGPVMIFLTTTAIELDEELLNRCLVLTVNESREQTQAIQDRQRFEETLEGLLAAQTKSDILKRHRDAQRLLKPLKVVNPYADRLTFLSDKTRTRRDHRKYLTLIRTIALLHQYQRETKRIQHRGKMVEYIEVTLEDIETANRLAHEVLGRTLDGLPPQTRRLLELIHGMVMGRCQSLEMKRCDFRFSRRDVREQTGWGNTQIRVHMDRLTELEYLIPHRGGRGQTFVYELLYGGGTQEERMHLNGLIDVEHLKAAGTTQTTRGKQAGLAESKRPQNGAKTGTSRRGKNGHQPSNSKALEAINDNQPETAPIRIKSNGGSHRSATPAMVAKRAE